MTIIEIMSQHDPAKHPGECPVILAGTEPRLLGYASDRASADVLAIVNQVSATYLSRAQILMPDGSNSSIFFVLHS